MGAKGHKKLPAGSSSGDARSASLAEMLDQLLPRVGLPVGRTNDLTQFRSAPIGRTHGSRSRYELVSPAILRFLNGCSMRRGRPNVPVRICGEMAGAARSDGG